MPSGKPSHGAQEDLVHAIDAGNFPSWTVHIQTMSEEAARNSDVDVFDVTKVWPHSEAPLREVGTLSLNRNVKNFFAETEQAAFSPSNLVPGIGVSPDRMLQARLIAYPDAHRYRLGTNFNHIPVNAPRNEAANYQRDGHFAEIPRQVTFNGPILGASNWLPDRQPLQGAFRQSKARNARFQ